MKVLFLVQKEQRIILDRLYDSVVAHCDCDLRWLSSDEQADLKGYFRRQVKADQYDRILMFLRFKKEMRQVRFISTLPNLVLLEHDAYQNYVPGIKYQAKFSRHYQHLPGVRVLNSGANVVRRLRAEGIDSVWVPKGYDDGLLGNEQGPRDIELAFVGSLKNDAYRARRQLLEDLAKLEPLQILRTNSGEDYRATLNRIRLFVSADVGMGEYMIKNFEAMACGCTLLAYDQGLDENQALGFEDMHNLVLYRSLDELREKLAILRKDPELAASIAQRGCELAQQRYRFSQLGQKIVEAMMTPLPLRAPQGWLARLRQALG